MSGFLQARGFGAIRWGAGAGLALALLVCASAAARPPATMVEAKLPATNEYTISLSGFRDRVSIDLLSTGASAGYSVRGHVGRRRVTADFEQFGAVDLRFEPSGEPRHPRLPAGCSGLFTVQRGVFAGTLALRDESASTDLEATRLRGRVTRDNVRCGRPEFPERPPKPTDRERFTEVSLEASDSRGEYGSQLYVTHRTDRKRVRFEAYRSRRIGSVSTYAGASAFGPRSSFVYDVRANTATVQPPPPFAGVGQLGRDDYSVPTWSGDLSISLFGGSVVPLTGGTFQASLSRARVVQITVGVGLRFGT